MAGVSLFTGTSLRRLLVTSTTPGQPPDAELQQAVRRAMDEPGPRARQVIGSMVSELVEAREFLANILESSTEYSIIAKDLQRRILSWNAGARRNYGYEPAEVIGRRSDMLHAGNDLEAGTVDRLHAQALATGSAEGTFHRRRKDGSSFVASVVITRRTDAAGNPIGYLVISRDITRDQEVQRRAEEHRRALEDSDRRKDEFLATLAHELRNPLAPMAVALELLERQDADPEARARHRRNLSRQLGHLGRLVDDLLDVARISQGKFSLRREPCALDAAVSQGVALGRPLLEERGHALAVDVEPGLVVDGDAVRLAQAVGNLVQNAAKYTPPHGHVRVSAKRSGPDALVQVSDDGVGIPREMLDRVFDLFVQAQPGSGQGGLGIGLTLVRDVARLHGGTVEATSGGAGRGATFTLRLPLVQAAAQAVAPSPPRRPAARRTILVVDDNADAADAMAEMLRLEGHDTLVAHDGPAALHQAAAAVPDVVLCDLGMPGMDGYEVARRLRADRALDGTLLVALSGYAQDSDRRRSAQAGFDAHVAKASSLDDLLRLVAERRREPAEGGRPMEQAEGASAMA